MTAQSPICSCACTTPLPGLARTEAFRETEGGAEPVDSTTDVLVDQDWHHRGPWGGSIDDHTHLSDVAI